MKTQRISSEVKDLNNVIIKISAKILGFAPEEVWNTSPGAGNFTGNYPVPKKLRIGTGFDLSESATRFSPPPFAVAVYGQDKCAMIVVRADKTWHRWTMVAFNTSNKGIEILIDLEGHTSSSEAAGHIDAIVVPSENKEDRYHLLARSMQIAYPIQSENKTSTPSWWKRPIYCGGGGQVGLAFNLEGPGTEGRMMPYCTQGLYERWLERFEQAEVPIGTVIIDVGWSPGGDWTPNTMLWPDLKGFIAEQHARGRHVLLWIATFFTEGLPDEWCIKIDNKRFSADPTNPEYIKFISEKVRYLISSEGLDADGFKVDQLQLTPSERLSYGQENWNFPIKIAPKNHGKHKLYGDQWGIELLYILQKTIYDSAKSVKSDALINSSTVHPYFYDTFDMIRLHDMGGITEETNIFKTMESRAKLSHSILPNHLIDTDNWVHTYYQKWVDYTLESYQLGVPCIFFSEHFILSFTEHPSTCEVKFDDLKKIGKKWREVFG